jgi:hypothetical protein
MLGVTAERFPKGGALLLGLMGSVGNLAISQALPQMGAIYDSYTVQALITESPDLKTKMLANDKGDKVPLVKQDDTSEWLDFRALLPVEVRERLFPAGSQKLNPDAVSILTREAKDGSTDAKETKRFIEEAEKSGAAWAFRWVAVLPCVLVVIFGLIAIIDWLRGGYKAVHIGEQSPGTPKLKPEPLRHEHFSRQ